MKMIHFLAPLLLISMAALGQVRTSTPPGPQLGVIGGAANQPFNLIIDSDLTSDVGDVPAFGLAATYQALGRINLLGAITTTANLYSAGCAQALLNYNYGQSNALVIGNYNGTPRTGSWINNITTSTYTTICANEFTQPFGNLNTNYAGHVASYRQMLFSAPNNSVRIVIIGTMSSYADLLNSAGDSISPLTGPQLVAQKVNEVVFQGGIFPTESGGATFTASATFSNVLVVTAVASGTLSVGDSIVGSGVTDVPRITTTPGTPTGNYGLTSFQNFSSRTIFTCTTFNVCEDVPAAQYVVANQPASVPMLWLDDRLGQSVSVGPPTGADQSISPYRRSFVAAGLSSQFAWDLEAVYVAVQGNGPYFSTSPLGAISVDSLGNTAWTAGSPNNQAYIEYASGAVVLNLQGELKQLFALSSGTFPESASYKAPTSSFVGTPGLLALYQPSNPNAVFTSGGNVTGLADLSGNQRNANIPTLMGGSNPAATAPTITASANNGLQALTFDGVHNALGIDSVAQVLSGSATPFDIYMVVSVSTVPTTSVGAFLDLTTTGQATHFLNRIAMIGFSSGLQCARVGNPGSGSYNNPANPLTANVWVLVECSYNPNQASSIWNTAVVSSSGIAIFNPFRGGLSTDAAVLPLNIGRIGGSYEDNGEGNLNLAFSVQEIAVIGRVLYGKEKQQKLRYLATRYGLTFTF